jgi:hypothetical protein
MTAGQQQITQFKPGALDADKNFLQDVFRIRLIGHPPADESQQPAAVLIPKLFQGFCFHELFDLDPNYISLCRRHQAGLRRLINMPLGH